ncbi:MAG: sulfotransferase domain-containing protein [Pseudomonadales bacterium]
MTEAEMGAPWINPEMQQLIEWRDQDIVISVPIKSGTTWMMNIVYQLLTGGNTDFTDIYAEVPWIEFVQRPGQPVDELLERLDAMPTDRPRAFKTHSAPPVVPYIKPGEGKNVRYIVVARNPEEALVSAKPFFEKHTDAFYDFWGVPKEAVTRPDLVSFYDEVVDPQGMHKMLFGFLASWWPLRHEDNVLFLHFADMKRDYEDCIHRVAEFLDVQLTPDQWRGVFQYTSFPWMKKHEDRFEARTQSDPPVLESGAMVRKGKAGAAQEDGMTPEISRHLRAVGEQVYPHQDALRWFYQGGLPDSPGADFRS